MRYMQIRLIDNRDVDRRRLPQARAPTDELSGLRDRAAAGLPVLIRGWGGRLPEPRA